MRPLPLPDIDTAFFWEACARGRLDILRCGGCATWIHPPRPVCRACGGLDLSPTTVSGEGTVHTFTVTYREVPGFTPPFVVALIELAEQPGLRLVGSIAGAAPEDVSIGMPVRVDFEQVQDVWLPVFQERR